MKLLENRLIITRAVMSISGAALVSFSIGILEGIVLTSILVLVIAGIIARRDRIESM